MDGVNYGIRMNADKIHFSFRSGGIISPRSGVNWRSSAGRRRLKTISWCGFAFNTKNFNVSFLSALVEKVFCF